MVLVILPCMGFQVALVVKKPPAKGRGHKRCEFYLWVGRIPGRGHSSILA